MPASINLFMTCIIFMTIPFFWLKKSPEKKAVTVTSAFCVLLLGVCILIIPLAYTSGNHLFHAACRITGMIIGIFFLFSCLQRRYCQQTFLWLVCGLLFIVILQVIVSYQQVFAPYSGWIPLYGQRIYGTFFQPNLLGSFVATGLALVLTLLLLPRMTLKANIPERCRQCVLMILLMAFSAILVLIQSRAGWIGAITTTLLLLFRFGRLNSKLSIVAMIALTVGVLLGIYYLLWDSSSHVIQITHEASNHARWTMLRDTLAMIVERPFLGWGYGSFEYSFQHFRISRLPPIAVTEIARHPHNEILLWVVEGGIVGLLGVIVILVGICFIIRQALHHDRIAFAVGHNMAGVPTALCIALLPIAIHTQLEFPFYISMLHFAVFLLLLAMADRISSEEGNQQHMLPVVNDVMIKTAMLTLTLVLILAGSFSLNGSLALAETEKFGMEDVTPLKALPAISRFLNHERVIFDEQVNALLTYNHSRDERLLEQYSQWAQGYLQHRIDKNVYASLIMILQHQHRFEMAELYRRDAVLLFPGDFRFSALTEENKNRIEATSGVNKSV
ncbi:PglL family O-oligosaccharyltransferase [Winslowiella toletana]|uniref:PglL family O-oligosaccharyltransferase n=1 Tax=Winslowiella toletana TaxID=92490 RepID=UPI0028BE7F85|nr:Wzy polymerase domain-containing protein [Winslowiella toletana]WNN46684.1 Wzy polymerase domain-containing protein [Winslowiella toletana]